MIVGLAAALVLQAIDFNYPLHKAWRLSHCMNPENPDEGTSDRGQSTSPKDKISVFYNMMSAIEESNLPFWINNGTLLSMMRVGRLNENDYDVDLCVLRCHFKDMLRHVKRICGPNSMYKYFSVTWPFPTLIVLIHVPTGLSTDIVFYRKTNKYVVHKEKNKYKYPLTWIFPLKKVRKENHSAEALHIPHRFDKVLSNQYGPYWKSRSLSPQWWSSCGVS